MRVDTRRDLALHDQPRQLLLKRRHVGLQRIGHGVEVHGDEGAEVLHDGLRANVLEQIVDMLVKEEVQLQIGLALV